MPVIRVDQAARRPSVAGNATSGRVVPFPGRRTATLAPARRALQLTRQEAWRIGLGAMAMVTCGWIAVELVVSFVETAVVTIDASGSSGSFACALFRMGCLR